MISAYHFGHLVFWDFYKQEWVYEDGITINDYRQCPKCGKTATNDGHDPCLANLTGVKNACCGHGVQEGYIQFQNGTTIRFNLISIERETT